MSNSHDEAIRQFAQSAAQLMHPGEDRAEFGQLVTAALKANLVQQARAPQAEAAGKKCHFVSIEINCKFARSAAEAAASPPEVDQNQGAIAMAARAPTRTGGGGTITVGPCTITTEWVCE